MSNRQWKYDEFNDLETINQYQIALKAGMSKEQALEIARHHSRDNARTPMQWSSEENAGFSKGKPWMPVNENYKSGECCRRRKRIWIDHKFLQAVDRIL